MDKQSVILVKDSIDHLTRLLHLIELCEDLLCQKHIPTAQNVARIQMILEAYSTSVRTHLSEFEQVITQSTGEP